MKNEPKKLTEPFIQLFWKALMIVLRVCPPLAGLVIDANEGQKHQFAAQMSRALFRHWRVKRGKRVVLPHLTVLITSRCTLNCDKCVVHIPDLEIHRDVPVADLLADLQTIFSGIDYVYGVSLIGGEPLLHPDLDQLVRACADSGKTGCISVVTNGTLISRDSKLLAALRDAKAIVKISKYPSVLQPRVEQLKAVLKENDIRYSDVHVRDLSWNDRGVFGQLQQGSAARRFSVCLEPLLCFTDWCGKLHLCGKSAILMSEGVIPDRKEDYVDLRTTAPATFRAELKRLNARNVISACSYCLGSTYNTPKIPVAVQRQKEHLQ